MPDSRHLHITRPDLPPLETLLPALQSMWESRRLTNMGPFHRQLEAALCEFLDVPALALFCNGTIALLAAARALELAGEVITTPFSFVATSHALRWAGLTPVFVDIERDTFTLDPRRIEDAITPRTRGILPVHVYGYPCDTGAIDVLADRHGLRVLYDAAHAFGVRTRGGVLLRAGDMSVLSFHATKVFHTLEGGAVICRDAGTRRRLEEIRNFGFVDEVTVAALGINGKMNELQAVMGLLQLPDFAANNARRAAVDAAYRRGLSGLAGLALPPCPPVVTHNHGYFPVRVGAGFACSRDQLYDALQRQGILVRRYFYPLISAFPMYASLPSAHPDNLPVARRVAGEILCLPIYATMSEADVWRVVDAVRRVATAGVPSGASSG